MQKPKELLVDTEHPDQLDRAVQPYSAVVVGGGMLGGYIKYDGHYVVRCFEGAKLVKFVIENQRYGKIVREMD